MTERELSAESLNIVWAKCRFFIFFFFVGANGAILGGFL